VADIRARRVLSPRSPTTLAGRRSAVGSHAARGPHVREMEMLLDVSKSVSAAGFPSSSMLASQVWRATLWISPPMFLGDCCGRGPHQLVSRGSSPAARTRTQRGGLRSTWAKGLYARRPRAARPSTCRTGRQEPRDLHYKDRSGSIRSFSPFARAKGRLLGRDELNRPATGLVQPRGDPHGGGGHRRDGAALASANARLYQQELELS